MYSYLTYHERDVHVLYDPILESNELVFIISYGVRDERCDGVAHFWEHMLVMALKDTFGEKIITISANTDLDCIYIKLVSEPYSIGEIIEGIINLEYMDFTIQNYKMNLELIRQETSVHTQNMLLTIINNARQNANIPIALKKNICYQGEFPSFQELKEEKSDLFSATQTLICNIENRNLLTNYGVINEKKSELGSPIQDHVILDEGWHITLPKGDFVMSQNILYFINIGVLDKKCLKDTKDLKLLLILSLIWNHRMRELRESESSYYSFCYINFHRTEIEFVFLISKSNGKYQSICRNLQLLLQKSIEKGEMIFIESQLESMGNIRMDYKRKLAAFYTEQRVLDSAFGGNNHPTRINELAAEVLHKINSEFIIVR